MLKVDLKKYIKIDFIKYIVISILSFVVDISLFTIFNNFFYNIFSYETIIIATILARIISSLFNYFGNSHFIFKHKSKRILIKYFCLVAIQMFVSGVLVYLINMIFRNKMATLIKIFVDTFIFIINYIIQKKVVFK